MIILKVLMCILLLVVVPTCMGLILVDPLERGDKSLALLLPAGYIVMMVSFEIVTVPIFLTTSYHNFKYVCFIYTPVMLALSALGVWMMVRREHREGVVGISDLKTRMSRALQPYRKGSIEAKVIWIIAVLILVVMVILAETRVIFDGDDAYYVTQSLISWQDGTMYVIQPYTGRAGSMDTRHALAVFTMWIAYIGKLTGIHTTVVCHTVLPIVIIPLTILCYLELGIRLLRKNKEMICYYIVFIELLILFGRVSIYTSEAFLMARTWQGKSMAANLLIPMTFVALMMTFSTENKARWNILICVNAAAGIFSSLAVVLVSVLILVGGFVLAIRDKKAIRLVQAGLTCVPGGLYMLLYIYFTYWGWR